MTIQFEKPKSEEHAREIVAFIGDEKLGGMGNAFVNFWAQGLLWVLTERNEATKITGMEVWQVFPLLASQKSIACHIESLGARKPVFDELRNSLFTLQNIEEHRGI